MTTVPAGSMPKDLDERTVHRDPIKQFQEWYAQAADSNEPFHDAMTLATATREGKPSARVVLLKEVDAQGFVFFTNYTSRKAEELTENPYAALVFHWRGLTRQVRIEGSLHILPAEESDEYFASRPRESQLGAVSSPQSKVIPDRKSLERLFQKNQQRFMNRPVPRPPQWGGYRLIPARIEFWQGREARLHDRIEYLPGRDSSWVIRRLAP